AVNPEVALGLSNRLELSHGYNGYAVITVACGSVMFCALLLWLPIALTFRLRFQFSLPTTSLEALSLGDTRITDAGLVHLIPLNQLRWLYLENINVSDEGLFPLAELTRLQYLVPAECTLEGLVWRRSNGRCRIATLFVEASKIRVDRHRKRSIVDGGPRP